MKKILTILILIKLLNGETNITDLQSYYDIKAKAIDGQIISMEKYRGKKTLIVNVASECGFTPQYEDLQKLYEMHIDNLAILGFPSNDFLWQEPGTNEEIKNFCKRNYAVTFQMFEKVHVN